MKKVLCMILAVIMSLSITACGGKSGGNGSDSNEPIKAGKTNLSWEEVKAKIPENLKGSKIVFYNWNEASSVYGAEKAIKDFTDETGIEVEWNTGLYNDYATNLAAMIAANNAPDVVRLRDMDPGVVPYLMSLSDLDYDFTDQAWNLDYMYHYQINGKQYAAVLKNTPFFQPSVTYYNRALIEKYGLEDPYDIWKRGEWTWDKLMEMCETFLSKAGDQYFGLTPGSGQDYAGSMGVSKIKYVPEENQYVSFMADTKLLEGWQWMNKNINKGLVTDQHLLIDEFNNGLILFYMDSIIGARSSHFYHVHLKKINNLGVVPKPSITGQETYYLGLSENEAYGIPEAAKNAEAVPYFLRYYLDADNYDMDKFYCDAQAKEVAEWCKSQSNITVSVDNKINKELYGEGNWQINDALRKAETSQVKSLIDSFAPVIDTMAKVANKKISSME